MLIFVGILLRIKREIESNKDNGGMVGVIWTTNSSSCLLWDWVNHWVGEFNS